MRALITAGLAIALFAGVVRADPSVQIRGAAVQVSVVPQARSDIQVTIIKTNPRLPLRIRKVGRRVLVIGDVSRRVRGCGAPNGSGAVSFRGRGSIAVSALPRLVIRTPLNVRLMAGDAVFGVIGRSANVDFTNLGCGDWVIANVRGHLHIDQAGSGNTRAGSATMADLAVAGAGRIATRAVARGLTAISSGSGDIDVAEIASGPMDVRIAGTGNIDVAKGEADAMSASIAGSGDVKMGGVAQSLVASITGPGDVMVAKVRGRITRRTFGSGQVKVGH